jgi:hypothetical protein
LFVLLFFSKSKKELPLVAFFRQEKIQQSFTRLSISIGARGAVVSKEFSVISHSLSFVIPQEDEVEIGISCKAGKTWS